MVDLPPSGQGAKRVLTEPMNSHRLLVTAARAEAAKRGLTFQSHSQDWVLELAKGDQRRFIYGYDFGLNSSATFQLLNDKAAFYDACTRSGIPALPHQVFLHPRLQGYVPGQGNWPTLTQTFEGWGGDVVAKNNEGSGGRELMRVRSLKELEQAAFAIFQVARALCLSPFVPINREIRVIMVAGRVMLAFEKVRTELIGDGRASILTLASAARYDVSQAASEPADSRTGQRLGLEDVPENGQRVLLDWRHNLGQGATPRILTDLNHPAVDLAKKAQATLNIQMTSLDVVETPAGWQIIEANSGVMLEHLSQVLDPEGQYAKQIYGAAIEALFPA